MRAHQPAPESSEPRGWCKQSRDPVTSGRGEGHFADITAGLRLRLSLNVHFSANTLFNRKGFFWLGDTRPAKSLVLECSPGVKDPSKTFLKDKQGARSVELGGTACSSSLVSELSRLCRDKLGSRKLWKEGGGEVTCEPTRRELVTQGCGREWGEEGRGP